MKFNKSLLITESNEKNVINEKKYEIYCTHCQMLMLDVKHKALDFRFRFNFELDMKKLEEKYKMHPLVLRLLEEWMVEI